jgi:hypothetical protein
MKPRKNQLPLLTKINRIPDYAIYAEKVRQVVYSDKFFYHSDRSPVSGRIISDAEGEPTYLYKTPTNADELEDRYGRQEDTCRRWLRVDR